MNPDRRNPAKIEAKLNEFLRETNQFFVGNRTDCVSFCLGYYKEFNEIMWDVIEHLCDKGYIRK